MGIFDSLFNKKDPKEVFDLTVKGLIPIRNFWIGYLNENGISDLIKPFLSDPTTLGYLLGFVEYIYTEYGVKEEEEASGVIYKVFGSFWSNIEECMDHFMVSITNNKEEINKSFPMGRITGSLYIKSITDPEYGYYYNREGKKCKESSPYFLLISEAPKRYCEINDMKI